MTRDELITEFAGLRNNAMFLSLHKYRNGFGEVANFTILFHANYKRVVEDSITQLNEIVVRNAMEERAKIELIGSCEMSLARLDQEAREDGYISVCDGVKVKADSGELYVSGLVHKKDVIERGEYPIVKHIKAKLRKMFRVR